jgi:phospholipid/cholesterol/gamma-HCH transport system substrate-binding protein
VTDRFPALKFGIFALICLAAAAWLMSVTGNLWRIPFLQSADIYEVELRSIAGLVPGDDVRVAGVRVGRVEEIHVERGLGIVTFEVDPQLPITDTWEAGVRWRNVIGQRYLYLYPVDGGQELAAGERIPVERTRRGADVGEFFNEITPLLRALDPEQQNKLLDALNTALIGREETVQDLMRDIGSLGSTVADQEEDIRSVLREGSALLGEYNRREGELTAFLDDLSDVGGVLRARNDELLAAVTDIGTVQVELGDMVRRNDDEIRALVDNVEFITDTIGANRTQFARSIATAQDGMATYMLISRWGQWFNVRIVAAQAQRDGQILYCQNEAGDECYEPNSPRSPGAPTSPRPGTPGNPSHNPDFEYPSQDGSSQASSQSLQSSQGASTVPRRMPALEAITDGALAPRTTGGER